MNQYGKDLELVGALKAYVFVYDLNCIRIGSQILNKHDVYRHAGALPCLIHYGLH